MIFITHPFEGETKALLEERELFGKFFTAHIINYFPDEVIFNFPINWINMRQEMGLRTTDKETIAKSIELMAKADGVIFINMPGRDLCYRSMTEKDAARRLNIPMVEFPFYRHRFDQQFRQNTLLTEQKRVLNLFRSALQEA